MGCMATTPKIKSKRSTSKEAYRLWFEFLKRAYALPTTSVDTNFYQKWGDVEHTKFEHWWKAIGSEQFNPKPKGVELVTDGKADSNAVLVSIPMSLTPTQSANALRGLLMQHYAAIGHTPHADHTFALTDGAEIKVSNFRAYLHTYDAYQRVLARGAADGINRTGKRDKDGKTIEGSAMAVSGKELLEEVRCFYLARTERWKNTKRTVEGLPKALMNGMAVNPVTKQVVNYAGDESSALKAAKRYLQIANKLIANAAVGKFPSDY